MDTSVQGIRHQSVVPYNKSYYGRKERSPNRTFFKGAAEYYVDMGDNNNSLTDRDQAVKKILEDQRVKERVEQDVRRSREEDLVNTSINSSRIVKKTITLKDVVE